MKALIRILFVVIVILLIGFYDTPPVQENEVLENEASEPPRLQSDGATESPVITDGLTRPKSGISTYVGQPVEQFESMWGVPTRIDPGSFNDSLWIYNHGPEGYIQVAVKDSTIRSVYVLGDGIDASPYYIGQPLEDVYRFTMVSSEIVVEDGTGVYQFELSEEDLHSRLLIPFGDVYAQLYVDRTEETIFAIRYLSKESLIEQVPYNVVYSGEWTDVILDPERQNGINEALEIQLFELTNLVREKEGLLPLDWDEQVAGLALQNSLLLSEQSEEEEGNTLEQRLEREIIPYDQAGETIAYNFFDAVTAIHGWLNSEDHRETMLDERYTHVGVGVTGNYFTQDYVTRTEEN